VVKIVGELFAWVRPAYLSKAPVDHTWVTTYDSRAVSFSDRDDVKITEHAYWYCYGTFHVKGGTVENPTGLLGSGNARLGLAKCLVQPNVTHEESVGAVGTILRYGRDGVCHQLANQVLFATATGTARPMIVNAARGYHYSSFLYGDYGLRRDAWRSKIQGCCAPSSISGKQEQMPATTSTSSASSAEGDDFESRARQVLVDDPTALVRLLTIREAAQEELRNLAMSEFIPTAEDLNKRNQTILDEAAKILSDRQFRDLFGAERFEPVTLVDKDIYMSSVESLRSLEEKEGFQLAVHGQNDLLTLTPNALSPFLIKSLAEHIDEDESAVRGALGTMSAVFVGWLIQSCRNSSTFDRLMALVSTEPCGSEFTDYGFRIPSIEVTLALAERVCNQLPQGLKSSMFVDIGTRIGKSYGLSKDSAAQTSQLTILVTLAILKWAQAQQHDIDELLYRDERLGKLQTTLLRTYSGMVSLSVKVRAFRERWRRSSDD